MTTPANEFAGISLYDPKTTDPFDFFLKPNLFALARPRMLFKQMGMDGMAMNGIETISIYNARTGKVEVVNPVVRTDAEWRALLTPEQYDVARKQGTEYAFTGKDHASKEQGIYTCACCGTDLFKSVTKFDSGTGWPSFNAPVSGLNIRLHKDIYGGMVHTEVLCARCGAHPGHVFDDGPAPTKKRYCMNSAALIL